MRRPLVPSLLVVVSLVAVVPAARAQAPAAGADAAARITRSALMATDSMLASPAFEGRLAGSPGYWLAAREMAARFAAAGLVPAGTDGFFQPFDVEWNDIRACRFERIDAAGARYELRHGPDYAVRGLSGSGDVEAPVVFAGYGVSWPERGYDDYAGLDVRGKIVLVIKDAPPFPVDSAGWGDRTLTRPRQRAAAAHGARAILIVPSAKAEHPQQPIGSMLEGPGPEDEHFPALQISVAVAESLLAGSAPRLALLQCLIDSTHAPHSLPLAARARVAVTATYHAHQRTTNVLAMLPGVDRNGPLVVVGGHLDHVGKQADLLFPGANDNGSGASAVLEIARAFASLHQHARVLFALFSSEEAGMLGSTWFVEHPTVQRDSIVAYLNLDCVGVGDSLEVGGGKTWPKMWEAARSADGDDAMGSKRGPLLKSETWPGGGADAQPFSDHRIPTAYFESYFSYPHLHLPSDLPATLNPPLFEAITRTAFRTAYDLQSRWWQKPK